MKRSTQIGLAAVGVVLVAAMWPRSDDEEALIYNTLADCKAGGQLSAAQCEARFNEASANHIRDAKKYDNSAACETEYGAGSCRSTTWNNATVFIPALAGIMLARSLAQGGGVAQPLLPPDRRACPPGSQQEGCQQPRSTSSSGGYYGGSSRTYSTSSGSAFTARNVSSTGVTRAPSTSSRGGFGSTARSFSSHSSS